MKNDNLPGGDVGDYRGDKEGTPFPPSPPLPDFIVRERELARRTVREATVSEIGALFSPSTRSTVLRVQMGRVPQTPSEWIQVQTAVSFIDHPPTEQGSDAREDRDRIIADMKAARAKLLVVPERPTFDQVYDKLDFRDYDSDEEHRASAQEILDEWTPPPPDPKLVRLHDSYLSLYPWITFYLGYRECPVTAPPDLVEPPTRVVRLTRDRLTLTSCKKARERAQEKGQKIHPEWEKSLSVMYRDVVAEIGICPPDVDEQNERIYTLHRKKNKLGYVPGNIEWADKSKQRDEQDRNGGPS